RLAQVDVEIDQSGADQEIGDVDDAGAGRGDQAAADTGDATIANEDIGLCIEGPWGRCVDDAATAEEDAHGSRHSNSWQAAPQGPSLGGDWPDTGAGRGGTFTSSMDKTAGIVIIGD